MKKPFDPYSWSRRKRLAYVTRRTGSLLGILARLALASRGAERQQTFDKLCEFMIEAGGVYTKFLQGVLLGVPEVHDWVRRSHVDFFENVPVEPLNLDEVLANELGEGISRLRIWPEVLASGTFSQVYAGILDFDKPVVIKVQRQTIRPSLRYDIWLLKKFARYGKPFLTSLDADTKSASRDFARITLAEMDYEREALLGELLRERATQAHLDIIIPKTYGDISTSHVLIQERLGGTSLAELLHHPRALSATECQTLQEMVATVLTLPFTTGLVHADPHPGNIRLIDDRHVGLLDFGALDDKPVEVDVYQRLLMAVLKAMDGAMTASEALDAYFAAYAPRLHRAIEVTTRALGVPPVLPALAKMSLGHQAALPQNAFKGNMSALSHINKLVNPGNRFALRSSLQNVSYARATHTIMHTMQLLGLKNEMIAALKSISLRAQAQTTPQLFNKKREKDLSVTEAKEIVYGWLEKVLERNPLMINELGHLFRALKKSTPENNNPPAEVRSEL
jgi:hypothetical protein